MSIAYCHYVYQVGIMLKTHFRITWLLLLAVGSYVVRLDSWACHSFSLPESIRVVWFLWLYDPHSATLKYSPFCLIFSVYFPRCRSHFNNPVSCLISLKLGFCFRIRAVMPTLTNFANSCQFDLPCLWCPHWLRLIWNPWGLQSLPKQYSTIK